MIVYGINPVLEALRAGRAQEIRVAAGGVQKHERLRALTALARQHNVPVREVPPDVLQRDARGGVHQGVVATVDDARDYSVEDLVRGAPAAPLIVVLDGIEDPQNLGAILRTADAAGADGVVIQSRRSAALGGAAAKASAGAVAHVRMAEVVNIARALEDLKEAGVWTVGLAGDAPAPYDSIDFTVPSAIVLGAEGSGLRRLVRERCDFLARIPMGGHVESLNVSVAAGITLFEAVRQRRAKVSA
ncbi:MAG: 23S rRNA (guanosine(2251)-2'-O)-methyltransferase RlmB [Acidimicrobiia bacterium]|nr:23S rRNA (guanosine(2251)-2'-O)-methyltransferase RlmB [Acidimicrobiia bacterium]